MNRVSISCINLLSVETIWLCGYVTRSNGLPNSSDVLVIRINCLSLYCNLQYLILFFKFYSVKFYFTIFHCIAYYVILYFILSYYISFLLVLDINFMFLYVSSCITFMDVGTGGHRRVRAPSPPTFVRSASF